MGSLFSLYLLQFGINSPFSLNLLGDIVPMGISLILALLGAMIAYLAYFRRSIHPEAVVGTSGVVYTFYHFFAHRWYINALYYKAIVYPIESASNWLYNSFEEKVMQPINFGASDIGSGISDNLRKLQSGIEEEYVLAFGIGIALIIILLVIFGQGLI
ncbi:MAG: hypothetical protein JRN15_19415 [Nitrososphaerota archaeon]|nr:hypothetical protein [Nitrososphaerota archaeon]